MTMKQKVLLCIVALLFGCAFGYLAVGFIGVS